MTEADARALARDLLLSAGAVLLGTVDADGYPHAVAMRLFELEELKYAWFVTKASSKRVARIRKNPKTCVYYCDQTRHVSVVLTGRAEVMIDRESRKRLWRDGFERVYKGGLDDPEFAVIRFRAVKCTFTRGRESVAFTL